MRTVVGVVSVCCLGAGALVWGCGSDCEAGKTEQCACSGGLTGVQICADDGTWGSCDCSGAGGTGGSTTTTSSSTGAGGTGGSTTSSTGGQGGACLPPRELCGTECVDTATDEDHCGECDNPCPAVATCTGGLCDCPGDGIPCGTECVDGLTDSTNCGGCGHDCGSDDCTGGFCPVTVLATGVQEPYALAVDDTYVYWFTHSTPLQMIWRTLIAGGSSEELCDAGLNPRDIAIVGTDLYWTNYGTVPTDNAKVWHLDLTVTPYAPNQLVPELPSGSLEPAGIWGIAVGGGFVYYANQNAFTVKRVSTVGGASQPVSSNEGTPWDLDLNASHVYWSNYMGGVIKRDPVGGGQDEVVASSQSGPIGVALSSTHVYWAAESSNAIRRSPLAPGGTVEDIATGQAAPTYVAVDDEYVYWTNYGNGTVAKAPLDGGTPTILAQNQNNPYYVAVDDTYCYWTTLAGKTPNGTVARVAK